MSKEINIQEKSIKGFLRENQVEFIDLKGRGEIGMMPGRENYEFLQDEIYLKKTSNVKPGDKVIFSTSDIGRDSGKQLEVNYQYSCLEYDDFSVKLKLQNTFTGVIE